MSIVKADDLADLTIGTLKDLGRFKFSNIAPDLVDYEVMSKWLKVDKVVFDSGYGITRQLMDKTSSVAGHVGLMDEDSTVITDHLFQLNIPWVHAQTQWSWELRTDVLMNRGKSLIQDTIVPRRAGAMLDMVVILEDRGWTAPSSSTDKKYPYGLPYYIVKSSTTPGGGFTGGAASGHTTVAGVNLTDHPKYKNWSANYVDITGADGIRLLRKTFKKIRFKPPVKTPEYSKTDKYSVYCNLETWLDISDYLSTRNDNLGIDLSRYDGEAVFNRTPIKYIPKLDADSSNPIYCVNHGDFYPVVLKGDYLRETVQRAPRQHNVTNTFVDLSYNFLCTNRRNQAVLYKV